MDDNLKKLKRVKLYRTVSNVETELRNQINGLSTFKYLTIKKMIDKLMSEYKNINYTIDYEYNMLDDTVIVKIENEFIIKIKKRTPYSV